MPPVAEARAVEARNVRERFTVRHPTLSRVFRWGGPAATGAASAFSCLLLSSAAAPLAGFFVIAGIGALIGEVAVGHPFSKRLRINVIERENVQEIVRLNEQIETNVGEIAGLRGQLKTLQAQLDEQKGMISKATLEDLAAKQNVIFRLKQRIPTLQKIGDLLGRAIKISRDLMESSVALPKMKEIREKALEEIEIFGAHQQAIAEEINDIEIVIDRIGTGNRQGLEHLNKAHYIDVRGLGEGGMGAARLYYYVPQDAWVVIKTILPEYQQEPELVARFRREATIAGKLQHPNLAKGFGYGGDEFVGEEFGGGLTPEALCKAIDCDKFEWLPHTPNHTVERLNELLRAAEFYDTFWVPKKPEVRLSEECARLIGNTQESRKKAFADLDEVEKSNIIRLNRLLLEAGYPTACPKSRLYLVTEFIRGKRLDDVIYTKIPNPNNPKENIIVASHKMPPLKVARMALGLIDAQAYMAGQKIIHRDLKPENIMIDADGHAKEIDFGIARQVGDMDRMTKTATALGTQLYMAPEQLGGDRDLTDKVDIYALGEVIFEALTAMPLFPYSNPAEFFNAKYDSNYAAEVIEKSEDVPLALKEILIRMLSVEKENRPNHSEIYVVFQSFLAALEGAPVGKKSK